jgi:hypothetical protein
MIRPTMALVAYLACLPVASAMVAAPRGDPGAGRDLAREVRRASRAPEAKRDLVITSETEILLDGRACTFDQIPAGADIILIDVAADRGFVRKIHFRSRK